MTRLRIQGGTLYDPAHGIDGQQVDLWIENGRMISAPDNPQLWPDRTLNATGLVIMPGGIDMHCHIAGPKVNTARKMRPEERRDRSQASPATPLARSGTLGSVPSTFVTGYRYLGLGYTTAFDAAVAPLAARHAHAEFADTPGIDKGCFLLVGNNHYVFEAIRQREPERLRHFLAWLLKAGRGYAPKIVNPGGVENWKQHARGNVQGLDDQVDSFDISPRDIIREIVRATNELRLPHPAHIHCNRLGMPGNWHTTLQTMQALEGHRAHLTHIQFHSYGGGGADEETFRSQVEPLAAYVNEHANVTVDVGQVLFGKTTSMTGDGPAGYYLGRIYGTKWYSSDMELEAGCGIAPIVYRRKSLVHALQWAIGLEWFLMVRDPWQVALSTDHPNGGSFLAYPQIIRLLMDRAYRNEMLARCPPEVRERCQLGDLTREYTLSEIAIITRAGPARMLGLTSKGHLGPGADADITLYSLHENRETMFSLPRYVIKAGEILIDDGEPRGIPMGQTLCIAPEHDPAAEAHIERWFEEQYSVRFANYPVPLDEFPLLTSLACG